jgi:hypothetical protein
MTDSPTPIRIAQVLGITGTAALAGVSFAISGLVIPRILESPTPLLLRQWQHLYDTAKMTVPPLAVVCASSLLYVAYDAHQRTATVVPHQWKAYVASALLALGIVPYTLLVIMPINKRLWRKVKETRHLAATDTVVEAVGDETAHALVDKWAAVNVGRATLLGAAAITAAWIALE